MENLSKTNETIDYDFLRQEILDKYAHDPHAKDVKIEHLTQEDLKLYLLLKEEKLSEEEINRQVIKIESEFEPNYHPRKIIDINEVRTKIKTLREQSVNAKEVLSNEELQEINNKLKQTMEEHGKKSLNMDRMAQGEVYRSRIHFLAFLRRNVVEAGMKMWLKNRKAA